MSNDSVAYSRAGDVFHYRWAARRSLHLIYPNSTLQLFFVEGSKEIVKAGEYVIDVTEYHKDEYGQRIDYYQLKHSTTQVNDPFTLSDLKETFEGFAKRFIQHCGTGVAPLDGSRLRFIILTNRDIDQDFIKNIEKLAVGEDVTSRFTNTITGYTTLDEPQLAAFCGMIEFQGEGNYMVQKDELRTEIAQLIAGTVDNPQLDGIVALIQDKVLPDADNQVLKEEILKRFGITFERELYPAPPVWEKENFIIPREENEAVKDEILEREGPFIVHAGGGVGKSVFTRQLVQSVEEGSLAIAYDCFGAGSYRNRSTSRHRHLDALVQIVNELASRGLCSPFIPVGNDLDKNIMRSFVRRVEESLLSLKKAAPLAKLIVIVDAADNAEMAALDFNQTCFAHEIIREQYPKDFRLVLLCRTERIQLLQPLSGTIMLPLLPFSEAESLLNLRSNYAEASDLDGKEFHRLTSGNPRVQANALDTKTNTVGELLANLGPSGITVEDQIRQQLQIAINNIKDQLPLQFTPDINSICVGLASLPPHIPIAVLAAAASVNTDYVKSFVSDIGRSLWLSDNSVQFRDEPTETWFRESFTASKDDYLKYIQQLEPLAGDITYVAEALPLLYLQAEAYEKLIQIALCDDFLPKHNPIDERNVRVFRLKFAFQAALKLRNLKDAIKLAMRAGEEVAGDMRQLQLLQANIDLLATLQSNEKAQQIAYRRLLNGEWPGAENIYAASILSFIDEFKGEARGYIRSARSWLGMYFKELRERRQANGDERLENNVQDEDILELAFAMLNVAGIDECFAFLTSLRPRILIGSIVGKITVRLIDHGRYDQLAQLLKTGKRIPEFQVEIADAMAAVGMFPAADDLQTALELLANRKTRIKKPEIQFHESSLTLAIVSFLEACLHRGLPSGLILRVLSHYLPQTISNSKLSVHHSNSRTNFIKALAIRKVLIPGFELNIDELLPEAEKSAGKKQGYKDERKEFEEVILGLFPWFDLRARVISRTVNDFSTEAADTLKQSNGAVSSRYRNYDFVPGELLDARVSILAFNHSIKEDEAKAFYNNHIKESKEFSINQVLDFTRIVFRVPHLKFLKKELEQHSSHYIKSLSDSGPEEISGRYVKLARAVIIDSPEDASVYFDDAITIISKFGDEITSRWDAISALGKQAANSKRPRHQTAYRFIRCAEVVGTNLREKHWDRENALQICIRLSAPAGIAALSRWRDRRIGNFDYLLQYALYELMSLKEITPAISWGFTKLQSISMHTDLVSNHLKYVENDQALKQLIFDDALNTVSKQGYLSSFAFDIDSIASEHHLSVNATVQSLITNFKNKKPAATATNPSRADHDLTPVQWDAIFDGLDVSTTEGLQTANKRLQKDAEHTTYYLRAPFWKNVFARTDERDIFKIIDSFFQADFIAYSDVPNFFSAFPADWLNKVSYKKRWPGYIEKIGEQFAFDLLTPYVLRSTSRDLKLNEEEINFLKEGIFKRLSQAADMENAEMFFNFVSITSPFLKDSEAVPLLDYAINRFELHIEKEFGDGEWETWLVPEGEVNYNLAGFLCSGLGSPWTANRWQFVHALVWLSAINATTVFKHIVTWLRKEKDDQFGGKNYLFYNLHARLYFLIACTKISALRPEFLISFSDLFVTFGQEPHALIQKFCAEIVNHMEDKFPGTYDGVMLGLINASTNSPFETKEEKFNYCVDSYWHQENHDSVTGDYSFGIDFPQYWYRPLGRVFGVSEGQICELAKDVILNQWQLENLNGYRNDPRMGLWDNSYNNERETWHDHGSYPAADTLDFYHCYHAMFVVAANLLKHMPIIIQEGYSENSWTEWLKEHALTFDKGKWIEDYRDAVPVERPQWAYKQKEKGWKKTLDRSNLLQMFAFQENGAAWLFVGGSWHEIAEYQKEFFRVSTALVNRQTSSALLNALATCKDPWDYKLPFYEEDDHEFDQGKFILQGWLHSNRIDKGIDQFDPTAVKISIPVEQVGDRFKDLLGLKNSDNGKIWHLDSLDNPVMIGDTYSSQPTGYQEEEPAQVGNRMRASLPFLTSMLKTLGMEMIFEMHVTRNFAYRSSGVEREKESSKYKIYILSADGTIRDAKKSYQLG